ncbi:MAG: hypothetical protein IT347_08300 [Candidatus Eisenbacteria bacterium]|nr:hypothetical protein [Candidatus Eisenbacteria bacterium]
MNLHRISGQVLEGVNRMAPGRRHPLALLPALALAACAGALMPGGAARAEWLPLDVGNRWQYMNEADEPHFEEITEPVRVRGRRMYIKTYSGGADDGLINFWMLDTDGSVLLGGYYRASIPFGLVYEPPVRIFPGSPVLGLEWNQHTRAIAIPDNVTFGEFDSWWKVQGHATLVNPAGSFDCFGVAQVPPPARPAGPALPFAPRGEALALDGRLAGPAAGPSATGPESAFEWYADDVGLVQYDAGTLYQLVSYLLPTPAAASSWGRVKSLYR